MPQFNHQTKFYFWAQALYLPVQMILSPQLGQNFQSDLIS